MNPSSLSRQMMKRLGVHSIADMKDFVHVSGKYEIAAVTGLWFKQHKGGKRSIGNIRSGGPGIGHHDRKTLQ
jgi:hypothetical protein